MKTKRHVVAGFIFSLILVSASGAGAENYPEAQILNNYCRPGANCGLTGAGALGQLAIWTGSRTLGGISGLSWNKENESLQIGSGLPATRTQLTVNAKEGMNSGILTTGARYGLMAAGVDNGVQGRGTGPASTGVYGIGEYVGVSGTSVGNGGYALYGQQLSDNGYSLFALGGKNYFSGNVGIGVSDPASRLAVAGPVEVGSANQRVGITLYDEDTGQPFCLSIASGAIKAKAGKCQ